MLGLRRGGHDPRSVYAAYADEVTHQGGPSVVLVQTATGYSLGPNSRGAMPPHQIKKMTPDQLRTFRDILGRPKAPAGTSTCPFVAATPREGAPMRDHSPLSFARWAVDNARD